MRYYRFGSQPYQYEYNWKGYPMASSKPPLMTFGDDGLEPIDPYSEPDTIIIEEPMIIDRAASKPKPKPKLTVKTSHLLFAAGLLGVGYWLTKK